MGTSKQDRQGARTIQGLKQEYNFGESFAEVYDIATGARTTAEEAKTTAVEVKEHPDHYAVFNALTEDGKCQGLYRDEDGNIYINAEFIKTGKLVMTKEMFLEPGIEVAELIMNYVVGSATIPEDKTPLYDFDNDGQITIFDATLAMRAAEGIESLAGWSGAKLSTVTAEIDFFDEENTIRFKGTDMWGKSFDKSIGIYSAFLDTESGGCMYRMDGDEKEWLNPNLTLNKEYRTAERYNGQVVYKKLIEVEFDSAGTKTVTTLIDYNAHTIVGINYMFSDGYTEYASNPNVSVYLQPYTTYYDLTVTAPAYGVCRVEIKYT